MESHSLKWKHLLFWWKSRNNPKIKYIILHIIGNICWEIFPKQFSWFPKAIQAFLDHSCSFRLKLDFHGRLKYLHEIRKVFTGPWMTTRSNLCLPNHSIHLIIQKVIVSKFLRPDGTAQKHCKKLYRCVFVETLPSKPGRSLFKRKKSISFHQA